MRRAHPSRRGFTLLELLVVVLIIAIVAVLAIPSIGAAQAERWTYDDASSIGELFRKARTQAVGHGAAQLVQMIQSGGYSGPNRGQFFLYQAQVPAGGTSVMQPPFALPGTPISSCTAPTAWPANFIPLGMAGPTPVDGADLNGFAEGQYYVYSTIKDFFGAPVAQGWLCFTPLGHVYYTNGGAPNFVPGASVNGVLQIAVQHTDSSGNPIGIQRTVIVPSSGATRIISK